MSRNFGKPFEKRDSIRQNPQLHIQSNRFLDCDVTGVEVFEEGVSAEGFRAQNPVRVFLAKGFSESSFPRPDCSSDED